MVSRDKAKAFSGEILVFCSAFLWSLSAVLSKQLTINAVLMNGLRCVFALILTLFYLRFKLKFNKQIAIGAICFAVTNIAYFLALKYTSSANAVVLQYTAPILVLVEIWIFKKKKPTFMQFFVVLMAIIGIIIIFIQDLSLESDNFKGNLFALVAGLAFSGVFYVNKEKNSSTLDSTCFGYIISIIVGAFFLSDIVYVDVKGYFYLAIMGLFQIGLAYILFSKGIKRCSSFSASLIATIEVVLLPLWVAIFEYEIPTILTAIGTVFIVGAVIINILYEKNSQKSTLK